MLSYIFVPRVDFLALETIPCLKEAVALGELLRDELPKSQAWISFSCKDKKSVCHGESLRECVEALEGFDQVCWSVFVSLIIFLGCCCWDKLYFSSVYLPSPSFNQREDEENNYCLSK